MRELLVISNWFPSRDNRYTGAIFVKEQLNALTRMGGVGRITVVSPQPYLYKQFLLKDYQEGVVYVHFPRFLYIPKLFPYHKLGDLQYSVLIKTVKHLNLIPDVVHAHFLWFSGYSGAKLKNSTGVPFVVTAHGYDVYDVPFRNDILRKKIEFVLNTADHIITVSKLNKDVLVEKLKVPEEKISVIPNGYDPEKFYPMDKYKTRELLGIPSDKYVLVSIGNLIPVKGHEYLIRAVYLIQKNNPELYNEIELYIIGDGKLRGHLQSLVRNLRLNSVHLVGARPHDEIPLWINASDIVIIPSLNEGVPTVLFEALGCGRPVIATRVGGIPEIINSEEVGMLSSPRDCRMLATYIVEGIIKKWDFKKIHKYSIKFSWANIAKSVLKIYKEVM